MTSDNSSERFLSREELYQRVWSTPMRKLALCFGISDVGLKKHCEHYNVPTPARGYWAKQEFGKAGPPPPLPAENDPNLQVIDLLYDPNPKPEPPPHYPVKTPELIALVERERDANYRITVPDSLRNPHPVVVAMREGFAARPEPDQYNLVRPRWRIVGIDVAVGANSVPRVLRLVNALFLALERRGWPVAVEPTTHRDTYERNLARCTVLGERFGFRLREKLRMIEVLPERRTNRLYDRKVHYEPRGIFELSITGTHMYPIETWRDGKRSNVEGQLNQVVVGLLVAVEKNRGRLEAARLEAEQRDRAERERQERERLERLEQAQVSELHGMAERWFKARQLSAFLEAVKAEAIRRQIVPDAEPGFARWLEWADQHTKSLDPLGPERALPVY